MGARKLSSTRGVSGLLELFFLLPVMLWILAVLMRSAARKDANARLLLLPVLLAYGFSVANNVAVIHIRSDGSRERRV
jgi:hypothetical protein